MAIIGLLFILGAGAVTAGAIYDGGESATIEVFGLSADTTIGGVFVAGLATMLIFFLGVWLVFSSMGRSRRKRMERKQARNRQKESVSQIEEERAQLRAENERLNEQLATGRGTTTAGTTAGAAAGTAAADRTTATDGTTDEGTTTGRTTSGSSTTGSSELDDRPQHVDGDRVVDHNTDLTARDETASSTSGRHRDL
jgi:ABC-type nickel/cobalt efflux system permease component RcnA